MTGQNSGKNAATLTKAYEQLRNQALCRTKCRSYAGLITIVRDGLTSWLGQAHFSRGDEVRSIESTASPTVSLDIDTHHKAIVYQLASMVLARTTGGV
jgi:hypothetical protein